MAEWGIKVSQPNKNVNTCADKDLAFSSQWNSLKIYDKGEAEIQYSGGGEMSLTINHNLGYNPASFVIFKFDNYDWVYSPGNMYGYYVQHYTTTSQLKIVIKSIFTASKLIYFKYLILIEENA